MLQPILTPQDCAACRLCCVFDHSDLWELPAMTAETAAAVRAIRPDAAWQTCGGGFVPEPQPQEWSSEGLYACPALGAAGCRLPADRKPFECSVWPFRVMHRDNAVIIAVSDLCSPMRETSRVVLLAKLSDGLAKQMFAYAAAHPESIKPFAAGYTELLRKPEASA